MAFYDQGWIQAWADQTDQSTALPIDQNQKLVLDARNSLPWTRGQAVI